MGHLKYMVFICMVWLGVISCHKKPSAIVYVKGGTYPLFQQENMMVTIPSLQVNQHEVTNTEFEEFIKTTGYITTAEKTGNAMVFNTVKKHWELMPGANWQHPAGPESNILDKKNHPVVQVSYTDACAYCEWKNMRLPYESEWEYLWMVYQEKSISPSNHWDGIFPVHDEGKDGFSGTSPVGYYSKNKEDIADLSGNVWEWCADYYHEAWPLFGSSFHDTVRYTGPPSSYSSTQPYDTLRVIKGGSYLCADNYCQGYLNKIRMGADPTLGYQHTGFRCVSAAK